MILKIAVNEGWKFIDGIKEIYVEKVDIKNWTSRIYSDVFLTYHTLVSETGKGVIGIRKNDNCGDLLNVPSEVSVEFSDGSHNFYLVDLSVYILSNEGKTVERIN